MSRQVLVARLALGLCHCSESSKSVVERSESVDLECKFARGQLLEIRSRLRSSDPQEQRLGAEGFGLEAPELGVLVKCGGVPLAGTCASGDRACMLHVTDWALAVVR